MTTRLLSVYVYVYVFVAAISLAVVSGKECTAQEKKYVHALCENEVTSMSLKRVDCVNKNGQNQDQQKECIYCSNEFTNLVACQCGNKWARCDFRLNEDDVKFTLQYCQKNVQCGSCIMKASVLLVLAGVVLALLI
eukprot:GFYU01002252.1.p1 GENE.GFYU01002252.1~~GFYU01002252.1.p1  ORF type:complete len:136 (-),score=40.51 GFYU01002252.1:155-562(-)